MHLKVLNTLNFFSGRRKSKSNTSRIGPDVPMEPRVVFVQEKRLSGYDSDAVYGTPVSSGMLQLPRTPSAHLKAVSPDNGLVLPCDVMNLVLSFTPIQHFAQCALVCHNWTLLSKQAAQLNLREARLLLNKGLQLMTDSNCPVESVKLFTKSIDLYPKLTEASFWKAKGLFILNDDSSAVKCLQAALIQRPATVERLKLQACIHYAQNNDLKASQLLEMALQKAPEDASIHFELGFCYHGLQQFARAVDCYTRAYELNYHRTFVLLANRANCYFRVGKVNDSLKDLEASLQISQYYELALRTRAFVNMHLGNSTLAYQDYTTIIEHSPTPKSISDAYCNRAFCYGDMDETDIERARQADPSNPEPVRYKASVLVNRGNTPEAIAHVTEWIVANPHHKDCSFQRAFRAELSANVSDWAAAIKDYEDAIQNLVGNPATLNFSGCNIMDTVATYRQRLAELHNEQRRARANNQ